MIIRCLSCFSIVLLIFLAKHCPVSSELVAVECVHNREDFEKSHWRDVFDNLRWAKSENDLPPYFVGKLVGQKDEAFYMDLSLNEPNHYLLNNFSWAEGASHAYIYIRYHAHSKRNRLFTGTQFYLSPNVTEQVYDLQPALDFKWKEEIIEIIPSSSYLEIAAYVYTYPTESFFFFDTIMFLQGNDVLNIEDALAICPPRDSERTSPATAPQPSTSDYVSAKGSSESSTMISTLAGESTIPSSSTFPSTANDISTPHPFDPALECVNYQNDFSSHNWQSYPNHEYSQDSTGLPAELQGKLSANGVFFLEGSLRPENKIFFKDYHETKNWDSVPTYLYLKYYAFITTNSSQALYVQPARVSSRDLTVNPPWGSRYFWEETMVQIEVTIEDMKFVEFGIRRFQPGEYLLVDKIAVVRANSYVKVLDLVQSCAED